MNTSLSTRDYSRRNSRWTVLWSILAMAVTAATAQLSIAQECDYDLRPNGYCPETSPRAGESRANAFQYKATHNSFQRSNDMDVQINTYSTFMLELDVQYDLDYDPPWYTEHDCCDLSGSQTLEDAFAEIASASTLYHRVTFLYLQQGDCACCECYDDWPSQPTYLSEIKAALFKSIPEDNCYTHADFFNIDDRRWPSMQELVRRGQNIVVFFSLSPILGEDEEFYFGVSTANPPEPWGNNFAISNTDGGCDIDTVDIGPQPTGLGDEDRWFYRIYPGFWCFSCCPLQDSQYWDNGMDRGYNFVATNCDEDYVLDPRIHSPMPIYIDALPDPWPICSGTGTKGSPYRDYQGLLCALDRVSPAVDIKMAGGLYSPLAPSSLVISKPMAIKTRGGTVTINPGR